MISVHHQVEAVLANNMLRARTSWVWEQTCFDEIVSELTSHSSHQDCTKSIAATKRHSRALQEYLTAVNELADFTLSGIVPERLENMRRWHLSAKATEAPGRISRL
jgi:hypothetical protein